MAALIHDHVRERHDRADRNAQDRAGRADGQRLVRSQQRRGQDQSRDDLEEHLEHLVDRGGDHIAVALAIAAIGRDEANEQDCGGHGTDRQRGVRIFQIVGGKPVRKREEDEGKQHADHRKGAERDPEGLFLLADSAVGVSLRHQARERNGKTRRRKREKDVVDAVRAHKHRVALVAENVAEGNLVYGAEHLHDDHADSEDRRTVHIVLLSASCH